MQVLNIIGGGKKLPTLSNPATAAQILAGYEAINGAGEILSGTYVPYYKQYLYQNCTSSSKDTTCTFTATGGTIDLAVCWLTDGYTITNILQYVGLYYNGNIIQAKCGSFTFSEITSVSGNIVTAVCDSTDVSNVGNSLRMHCVIFSH